MATHAVAASGLWRDDDGIRMPAGEVHAWLPGQNQTLCGARPRRDRGRSCTRTAPRP